MNEATKIRLELAKKNAERYATNPKITAMMVTGSVGQGRADDSSDIDCSLYYNQAISAEEFQAACQVAKKSGGGIFGGTAEEGFAVYEYIEGIRCDFAHSPLDKAEALMQGMLDEPDVEEMSKHIVISGFLDCIPLFGKDWIETWKTKLREYPPELAEALLKKHLRFQPRWVLEKMGVARNDILFLHESFIEAEKNIFGILCGLNRLYHPGKLKGMAWTVSKMTLTPPDLMVRSERVFQVEPAIGVAILSDLIEETLTLVETHQSEIDTTRAREVWTMVLRK